MLPVNYSVSKTINFILHNFLNPFQAMASVLFAIPLLILPFWYACVTNAVTVATIIVAWSVEMLVLQTHIIAGNAFSRKRIVMDARKL